MHKLRGEECVNLTHLFVATRREIFSLKLHKYRLPAGVCPDPQAELQCSPDPLTATTGAYF